MRAAGKPFEGVKLRVRRSDGTLADIHEIGEIETRSGRSMLGYWNLPDATEESYTEDDWFKTGDAGYLDEDGYLYIRDRIKDVIISGGENIYPAEVENALRDCPGVAEVAVIGVPDEKWGEAVKAIVVAAPGKMPTAESVIAFAKARIAHFKAPKSVEHIECLPKDVSGRVLRRQLRQRHWVEFGKGRGEQQEPALPVHAVGMLLNYREEARDLLCGRSGGCCI